MWSPLTDVAYTGKGDRQTQPTSPQKALVGLNQTLTIESYYIGLIWLKHNMQAHYRRPQDTKEEVFHLSDAPRKYAP